MEGVFAERVKHKIRKVAKFTKWTIYDISKEEIASKEAPYYAREEVESPKTKGKANERGLHSSQSTEMDGSKNDDQ